MSAEQTPDTERALTKAFHRDATFGHGAVDKAAECGACRDVMAALAPVLAAAVREAEQRALREAADVYRALDDSLPICAGHVTAELDYRADRVAEPQHEAATSGGESEASDE